jgi:hypothetical protein
MRTGFGMTVTPFDRKIRLNSYNVSRLRGALEYWKNSVIRLPTFHYSSIPPLQRFLGGLLLALADLPAIDEHVVLVSDAVDADRTERERLEAAAGESPTDRVHCFHVASF